jgi:flavin-dependent dehydrogenase
VGCLESTRDDSDASLTVEKAADGWWYTCRLPGQRRVAAWITETRPDRQTWLRRLRSTRHVSRLVEGYRMSRGLLAQPASSSLLDRVCGPGWLAIGDAAACYDPLSSRGIVSALRSGLEAATLVGASAERLADYQTTLRERFHRYLEQRQGYYSEDSAPGWGTEDQATDRQTGDQ